MNINRWTRGRQVSRRLFFGGGYPKYRLIPFWFTWGPNVSFVWLGTEFVWRKNG